MQLSLVIPLYNEAESLEQLHREICGVAEKNNYNVEIIFIDDGSTDQSWNIIEKISANDSRVRGIQFRRNFGKAAALQAGFKAAQGDFILTLDADLQDDPKEIPDFLRLMETGLDVVSGWKQRRHDPWHKVFPSRVFNGMIGFMTGVKLHDHNCGMKCYRREVLDEIALYGERHRFIPVLAAARGYKVGEKVVAHRARQFGQSKYGFTRFAKGFLDLLTIWFLTRYGQRPQHFLGTIGLTIIALGIVGYCLQVIGLMLGLGITVANIFVACVAGLFSPYFLVPILLGVLFIALGFVAELFVSKTIQADTCYAVRKER
ncbi:MAG: glycosyltransferase [Planctomycetaceae bacterium]|nr:glycosyltransferase [Planctomycetaceae bacterium]